MKIFGTHISFGWVFRKSMKDRIEDALYESRTSYMQNRSTAEHYQALTEKDSRQIAWLESELGKLAPKSAPRKSSPRASPVELKAVVKARR